MKEKVLLIFFLCNVALFVSAQSHMEKGLQSISRSSTEAIINFLAGTRSRIPWLACSFGIYCFFIAMDKSAASE